MYPYPINEKSVKDIYLDAYKTADGTWNNFYTFLMFLVLRKGNV